VSSYYHDLSTPSFYTFSFKRHLEDKSSASSRFFVWTAVLGKILTNDNLRKRHAVLGELVLFVLGEWGIH
jgi:hypothetical protein